MSPSNDPEPVLDPRLERLLTSLHAQQKRTPQAASLARQAFMDEIAQLAAVSKPPETRLNRWTAFQDRIHLLKRKEKATVFNFVALLVLVFGAVFGGGAATVAAAEGALPGEPLYAVKTWTEQLRLGWENEPQGKLDMAIQLTARRAEEIAAMLMKNASVPEETLARYQQQHQFALQLAAGLPADQVAPALLRLQQQIMLQQQTMLQLQMKDGAGEQTRTRLQTMLQTQLQATEKGIEDPDWLHEYVRSQFRLQIQAGSPAEPGEGNQPDEAPGNGPQFQNQPGGEEPGGDTPGPGDTQQIQQGNPDSSPNSPSECDGTNCQPQNQQNAPEGSQSPQPNPQPEPNPNPGASPQPDPGSPQGEQQNGGKR